MVVNSRRVSPGDFQGSFGTEQQGMDRVPSQECEINGEP